MPSSPAPEGGRFGRALERLRRNAGFTSAYQFYHKNGGRKHFPFTYMHYLRLERKGHLPRPQWLARIMLSLRLETGQEASRELFDAYLRDMLVTDEAYELVAGTLLRAAAPAGTAAVAPSATEIALTWLRAHHTVHLTPEQFRGLAAAPAVYWCHELLANDSGAWTGFSAAQRLGLSPKAAAAAFGRLKELGLARETSPGRFKAREAGKVYTWPGRLTGMGRELDAVLGYWQAFYEKNGSAIFDRVELVRAEAADVRAYLPNLFTPVEEAAGLARHDPGKDTGLYAVETRVRRLLKF
ncbi:MAG: hypothetical protein HY928_16110 [Elusimicrobia bacterium]|nr:hypothetical protein [Elusimicrobiota bacterium]